MKRMFMMAVIILMFGALRVNTDKQFTRLENQIENLAQTIQLQNEKIKEYEQDKQMLIELIKEIQEKKIETPNRGIVRQKTTFNVTAYTLRKEECGKSSDHPLYGITASGKHVTEWQTIAAPKSIPFGTKVYIPYFKDMPNKGIFIVEDRGGAIKEGHLDIYMEEYSNAIKFGRRDLEVHILD